MVPRISSPLKCWFEELSSQPEQKLLQTFLLMHGLSIQQTENAVSGMRYRYLPICLQRQSLEKDVQGQIGEMT